MSGHHIYTRSWYEHESSTRNPGTFTVELTDGLFGANAHDVIYQQLNKSMSGNQPSVSGYKQETSLLRIYHPTPESTITCRTYFVNDEITGRGVVQYSYGLVFSRDSKMAFLRSPAHAFKPTSYEPYEQFVKRVTEEGRLKYSDSYDPRSADYSSEINTPRKTWESYGFHKDLFESFFAALGNAITSKRAEQKVAVLLPEGKTGEEIILAVLSILPIWFSGQFGAVSRWGGAFDNSDYNTLIGIHLAFYSGDRPSHDTTATIIDLTGGGRSKFPHAPTDEQKFLAQWYWQNIDNSEARKSMEKHMTERYANLLYKMPFSIFAHCFWLWDTFYVNENSTPDFKLSADAIDSLFCVFGKNVDKFFTNKLKLAGIFDAFYNQLDAFIPANIKASTVNAICALADADYRVGDGIKLRDFVKPLADRLFQFDDFGRMEPIFKYYTKILRENNPKNCVSGAIEVFSKLLHARVAKYSDGATSVLSTYANACVEKTFKGEADLFSEYQLVAAVLKNAGRTVNTDLSVYSNFPKNIKTPRIYFEFEKFSRENIDNSSPPGAKLLDNMYAMLLNSMDGGAMIKTLLELYWQAARNSDYEKYIDYLLENSKLKLYLHHYVGAEEINDVMLEKMKNALDVRDFADGEKKAEEILSWFDKLHNECGFQDFDAPVYLYVADKLQELGNNETLIKTMDTPILRRIAAASDVLGANDSASLLRAIISFDEKIKNGVKSLQLQRETSEYRDYFYSRMIYLSSKMEDVPVEWALSRALIDADRDYYARNSDRLGDAFLEYKTPQSNRSIAKDNLINLYEAVRLTDDYDYKGHMPNVNAYEALENKVLGIVAGLIAYGKFNEVFETGGYFRTIDFSAQENNLRKLGRKIAQAIKENYDGKPPIDELRKFDMSQKEPKKVEANEVYSPADSIIMIGIVATLFVGLLSLLGLLLSDLGVITTIYHTFQTELSLIVIVFTGLFALLGMLSLLFSFITWRK